VGHGELARERRDPPLVEDLAHHPEILVDHQVRAVGDADAGRLLAAVLEREEGGRRDGGGLVAAVGQDDPTRRTSAGLPARSGTAYAGRALQPSALGTRAPRRAAGRPAASSASAIRPRFLSRTRGAPPPDLETGPPVVLTLHGRPWCGGSSNGGMARARLDTRRRGSPNSATAGSRRRAEPQGAAVAPDAHLRHARPGPAETSWQARRAAGDRLADERCSASRPGGPGRRAVRPRSRSSRTRARETRAGVTHQQHGCRPRERRADAGPHVRQHPTMPISGVGAMAEPGVSL
jgi:hypothetical protein